MSKAQLLNYETAGSGEPVLLIHGLFGDLDNLKGLGRDLQQDFQIIMIDVRNHGDSFHSDTMNYADMADDVARVLDHLELNQVHIVGHSMGGKLAMEFALANPDRVISLIVADIAPVAYDTRHRNILDALEALDLSKVSSRKDADQLLAKHIDGHNVRQFLLKNLERREDNSYEWRLNLPVIDGCYGELSDAVREGTYDGPVLFIKGGDSDYLTQEYEEAIRARFSNVDLKVIEGAGHWLHAEKPRIFNRTARSFLEQHSRT